MPPYDELIKTALQELYPGVEVSVTSWPIAGQTLAQIEAAARKVRSMKPDLVLIAVPAELPLQDQQQFHHDYSWIMNWSLSFGPQEWDVIVAPPSTAKPQLTGAERQHEQLARRLVKAQDLSMIERAPGDATPLPELLSKWIAAQAR